MNSDQMLWSKFKQGDKDAYATIYDTYVSGLIAYGRRFTNDEGVIEDCIHDLFVYIWNKRASISDTDSISRYLIGSLRNNLINALKKQSKTSYEQEKIEQNFEIQLSQESSLIQADTTKENKDLIEKAMQNLSNRQKEAIYLKFFKHYSNEEICEIMNLNNQSLRNLLSSGIKRMRGIFIKTLVFLSTSAYLLTL